MGQYCIAGSCHECRTDGTGCRFGRCDTRTLTCVECLANASCPGRTSCGPDHQCN
jgi:hypothetical protein